MTSLNISIFQNPKRSLVQGFLHGGRLMFEGGWHSFYYFYNEKCFSSQISLSFVSEKKWDFYFAHLFSPIMFLMFLLTVKQCRQSIRYT